MGLCMKKQYNGLTIDWYGNYATAMCMNGGQPECKNLLETEGDKYPTGCIEEGKKCAEIKGEMLMKGYDKKGFYTEDVEGTHCVEDCNAKLSIHMGREFSVNCLV